MFEDTSEGELLTKLTIHRTKKLALDYINRYFYSKRLYSGGPIPKLVLEKPETISKVLNISSSSGFKLAHKMLGEPTIQEKKKVERTGDIYTNTKIILDILKNCSLAGIPKCFAAGILVLHLEICEGCNSINE